MGPIKHILKEIIWRTFLILIVYSPFTFLLQNLCFQELGHMKWTLELESFKWFLHYRDNRLENPDFISEPKECTFCQSNTVSLD